MSSRWVRVRALSMGRKLESKSGPTKMVCTTEE